MKFLKSLLIVLVSLFAIYIILAFLGAKNYKVVRKKEINVPASIVWQQIYDFKTWPKWSPWQEKDSTIINLYTGEAGSVGAKMSWVGDKELSGNRNMIITDIVTNKKISYDLSFIIPMEMKSARSLTLNEKEGVTTLTWLEKGDFPFLFRPFMLFIDKEAQIAPYFERGLFKIDSLATEQYDLLKSTKDTEITEATFSGKNYVAVRHKTTFTEVMSSEFYKQNFQYLGKYVGETKSKLSGSPSSIIYVWNEVDSTCEIALAFPIEGLTSVNKPGYEFISIGEQKAILGKCYGGYDKIGVAHEKLNAYAIEKGLKIGLVIEEQANDATTVPEYEILTNIYYLIEE
jgi:hypothetical protein